MTVKGRVQNGVIVTGDGVELPEGAEVRIEVIGVDSSAEPTTSDLFETLKPIIGVLDDQPEDFAANHDHYIHGAAKRDDQ